jgi:hypothetical protein
MNRPRHDQHHRPGGRGSRRGVIVYVGAWLAGAAIVATLLIVALDGGEPEEVSLPPVRQVDLMSAAREAGCELRRAGRGVRLNPPVDGPAGATPAAPRFYDEAPAASTLVAALRRGIVVIHFRAGLDGERVQELRRLQEAVPAGTIVTTNATGMPYAVGVTAYRRLLGCRTFTDGVLDAIRLFHGRYIGTGPDRAG